MTEFDRSAADENGSTADELTAPDAEVALPVLDVEDEVYGISAEDKYNEAAEDSADEAWARAAAELSLDADAAESGPPADTAEEPAEPVALDPVEELRAQLRRAPGDWFVVHSYAGYENKVKTNLESRISSLD
ncbi:MAG TPA: hypothetical protein VF714_06340, partial [Jatrophihabitans sp.]